MQQQRLLVRAQLFQHRGIGRFAVEMDAQVAVVRGQADAAADAGLQEIVQRHANACGKREGVMLGGGHRVLHDRNDPAPQPGSRPISASGQMFAVPAMTLSALAESICILLRLMRSSTMIRGSVRASVKGR